MLTREEKSTYQTYERFIRRAKNKAKNKNKNRYKDYANVKCFFTQQFLHIQVLSLLF